MTLANVLTFSGGLIRCVSTFPGLEESFDPTTQYWCAVVAQILVGMANPMGFCLPTKVSNDCVFCNSFFLQNFYFHR